MNINRIMTNKILCLRSNFDGALLANGVCSKLKSEIYYGVISGDGIHRVYISSHEVRNNIRHKLWFKLSK